jgi:hypothetical protein
VSTHTPPTLHCGCPRRTACDPRQRPSTHTHHPRPMVDVHHTWWWVGGLGNPWVLWTPQPRKHSGARHPAVIWPNDGRLHNPKPPTPGRRRVSGPPRHGPTPTPHRSIIEPHRAAGVGGGQGQGCNVRGCRGGGLLAKLPSVAVKHAKATAAAIRRPPHEEVVLILPAGDAWVGNASNVAPRSGRGHGGGRGGGEGRGRCGQQGVKDVPAQQGIRVCHVLWCKRRHAGVDKEEA